MYNFHLTLYITTSNYKIKIFIVNILKRLDLFNNDAIISSYPFIIIFYIFYYCDISIVNL